MTRQQYRTVGTTEKIISGLVLIGLVAIAATVYLKGQRYDPDLFALNPEFLAAIESESQTVPHSPVNQLQLTGMVPSMDMDARGNANTSGFDVIEEVRSAGWQSGSPEFYTPNTLYEKINGRAPIYFAYDVVSLEAHSLSHPDFPDAFIDVFIYDMGKPLNAFGIFTAERSSGQTSCSFGNGCSRDGPGLFFWQGQYYNQVLGSIDTPAVRGAVEQVATALQNQQPQSEQGLDILGLFPPTHQVSGSIMFHRENAYGLSFMDQVYQAKYQLPETEATVFVLRADNADHASELFERYHREYLSAYGEILAATDIGTTEWTIGDMGWVYDLITVRGEYLLGIIETEDHQAAARFGADFLKHFDQISPTISPPTPQEPSVQVTNPVESAY